MKKINSRQKGARGERQWRDELRANGYEARRGQQFSGSAESPDVVCPALAWLHFEVKCVESLNLRLAMEQARRDGRLKIPVVAHRRKFWPWLVTMESSDLFDSAEGFFSGSCFFIRSVSKRLNVHEAMKEAERAADKQTAFLVHLQKSGGPWLVTMTAETFFKLLRAEIPGVSQFKNPKNGTDGTHRTNGKQGTEASTTTPNLGSQK